MHDFSFPEGRSINIYIDKEKLPCKVEGFETATSLIKKAGRGCFLFKIDWNSAYQQVLVAPAYWELCGFKFEGKFYVDTWLPYMDDHLIIMLKWGSDGKKSILFCV